MKVQLREDYQVPAFTSMRDAIRNGAKSILVNAPTGSGKTVIASALMELVMAKGNRANFVVDRLSLVDQTSDTFDRYGLAHGVIQSEHSRYRPSLPIQICSAQTLLRRGWPESNVDVIDECHILSEDVKKRIASKATVIVGLTATPFTKGLGKWFDAVVNVTTTNRLIEQGWLAPYRIFSCVEPDMNGVKVTKLGEWDDKESTKKALEVVGDVVQEYLKHGEGRKFICSGVTIAHCEELTRQFQAAGINVCTYTANDRPEDRQEVVAEFRKPDSSIRGLVTVTAASRGFDVPDVSCVIMARPLRKSFAEHLQLFGRGLRICEGKTDCIVLDHCIASGQRVLTHRGLVAIEEILLTDKLWDGHEFVAHKGVVSRGIRPIIRYAGLAATADHPVKTTAGWRTLGQCAEEQTPIITTGVGRTALRERDGYFTGRGVAGRPKSTLHACALRVRHLWLSLCDFTEQLAGWAHQGMPALQSASFGAEVASSQNYRHEAAMHESEGRTLPWLWRQRDRVPFRLSDHLRSLDRRELRLAGEFRFDGVGPDQQRRPLRSGESSLGDAASQHEQHSGQQMGAEDAPVSFGASRDSIRGRIVAGFSVFWAFVRGHRGTVGDAISEAEGQVWDVLDCGPRNSFTCEGLLVHNSGNCARFWQDMLEFFENGISELDDGKPKKKPKAAEKQEAELQKCPTCRHLHKPMPFCPQCGHQYPPRKAVQHVPGSLTELIATRDAGLLRRELWPQICWYVREHKSPRDDMHAQKMAQGMFISMVGEPARARYELTTPKECSREVALKIQNEHKRWVIARRAAERKSQKAELVPA